MKKWRDRKVTCPWVAHKRHTARADAAAGSVSPAGGTAGSLTGTAILMAGIYYVPGAIVSIL